MACWKDDKGRVHPLAKCPFCGKEVATIVDQYELNDYHEDEIAERMYTVVCDFSNGGCGATGGFRTNEYYAALQWNTRMG